MSTTGAKPGSTSQAAATAAAIAASLSYPSVVLELLSHIIVGTAAFVIIALAAVGLNFLVRWLEFLQINSFIIRGLQVAEYTLFIIDLVLFMIFVLRKASNARPISCAVRWLANRREISLRVIPSWDRRSAWRITSAV